MFNASVVLETIAKQGLVKGKHNKSEDPHSISFSLGSYRFTWDLGNPSFIGNMILHNLLTFLIASGTLANAYHYLDCMTSLPSSWSLNNTYEYQSSSHCSQKCNDNGSKYFALAKHNECYCGDEIPLGDNATSCNAYCYGYKQEMCGGSSTYSVYSIGSEVHFKAADIDDVVVSNSVVVVPSTVVETVSVTGSNSAAESSETASDSTAYSASGSQAVSSESQQTAQTSGSTTQYATSESQTPTSTSTSIIPTTSASSVSPQSTSVPASSSQSLAVSTTTNGAHMTSIIYATSYRTQSGSTIYQTVTTSAAPSSSPDQDNTGKKHKKNVNVGAIVGGVVGGVGGAAVASVILLFLIRHFNKRREQERMEQEYQEAIKPVDFGGDKSHVANSSILSLNRGPSSGSFDEEARSGHATNPFDDSRRISNGSILREESPSNPKVLTVVNPDEHD